MAFQGLHTSVSGMLASQAGLYVTGHNMANHSTRGFTRQIVTQAHFTHRTIGTNASGIMQVGLGTQMTGIRQIRDHFLDVRFRETAPRLAYWETRAATHLELDSIFGELEGHYRLQLSLTNLNAALNELNNDPSSIETRGNFISQAVTFLDRANAAQRSMFEYQMQLNNDIIGTVQRVNQLITEINDLNSRIVMERNQGLNPNDFLDWRNNALDELSNLIDIQIIEVPGGSLNILTANGGHQLLVNGQAHTLGLRHSYPGWPFVEPVFTSEDRILRFDEIDAPALFNWNRLGQNCIVSNGGERGHLLSLLTSRGLGPTNYQSHPIAEFEDVMDNFMDWLVANGVTLPDAGVDAFMTQFETELRLTQQQRGSMSDFLTPARIGLLTTAGLNAAGQAGLLAQTEQTELDIDLIARRRFDMNVSTIPQVMAQLDTLVNGMVLMFNNAFTSDFILPDGTNLGRPQNQHGLRDGEGNPPFDGRLFIRQRDGDSYTLGNLEINPILLGQGGASFLALTFDGESDNRLTLSLMNHWNSDFISFNGNDALGINTFYRSIITGMANGGREAINAVRATQEELEMVQMRRQSISAVSLEEEMSNMIRYQHAFNASSRMINTIDSMIDRLVNGLGAGRG
ncbi:MAG: hypothetical protein FWE33_05995 [Defluviitaleaceae bacterium]|nr:hypothetical protein [Defluviitaleaceae bacterium]